MRKRPTIYFLVAVGGAIFDWIVVRSTLGGRSIGYSIATGLGVAIVVALMILPEPTDDAEPSGSIAPSSRIARRRRFIAVAAVYGGMAFPMAYLAGSLVEGSLRPLLRSISMIGLGTLIIGGAYLGLVHRRDMKRATTSADDASE